LAAEHIQVSSTWRRGLGVFRVLLALACLLFLLLVREPPGAARQSAFVLLLAYAVVALFWRKLEKASYSLLCLIIDSLFFLIWTAAAREDWITAAFYLYLMAAAVVLHHWRQVALVSGVCLVYLLAAAPPHAGRLWPPLLSMSALALAASWQKRWLANRLFNASRQAVLFRSEAEKAREAERQRIAADFHDGPLQSFISFQLRLEVVRKLLERDLQAASKELVQLQELAKSQTAELRAFVRSMRPIDVDGAGFSASVSRLVEGFQKETGISATFLCDGSLDKQPPEVATELLQIIREALHNVQKHSRAARVAVAMEKGPEGLEISIQDDGKGFAFSGAYSLDELDLLRLGPASIKRRVQSLGGDMTIESRPGEGAGLKIKIPSP